MVADVSTIISFLSLVLIKLLSHSFLYNLINCLRMPPRAAFFSFFVQHFWLEILLN